MLKISAKTSQVLIKISRLRQHKNASYLIKTIVKKPWKIYFDDILRFINNVKLSTQVFEWARLFLVKEQYARGAHSPPLVSCNQSKLEVITAGSSCTDACLGLAWL